MTLPRIDFVVFYDYFNRDSWKEFLPDELSDIGQIIGAECTARVFSENSLDEDPQNLEYFPTNAVFYVHGAQYRNYDCFDRVCQISPQRPDLKFIVEFDNHASRKHFSSDGAYQRYRECPILGDLDLLESEEAIRNTGIIAHYDAISGLLPPPNPNHPSYFQQYLSMLLKVRRNG